MLLICMSETSKPVFWKGLWSLISSYQVKEKLFTNQVASISRGGGGVDHNNNRNSLFYLYNLVFITNGNLLTLQALGFPSRVEKQENFEHICKEQTLAFKSIFKS